jgi:hypothetical protein
MQMFAPNDGDRPLDELTARSLESPVDSLALHRNDLSPIGVAKAAIAHNTADLAQASGMKWTPPGMVNLLHGNVFGFFRQIFDNHWSLVLVFFWQILLALASLVLGFIGLTAALLDRSQRLLASSLLAVVGYYTAMIGVVGMDAYSRNRSMIIPIAVIFTAIGIEKVRTYFPACTDPQ